VRGCAICGVTATGRDTTVAYGCGMVILVALFFGKLAVTEMPDTFGGISKLVFLPQFGLILAPTLLIAMMMTHVASHEFEVDEREHCESWALVSVLAVMLHPLYMQLAMMIGELYPLSPQAIEAMRPFGDHIASATLVVGGVVDGGGPPRFVKSSLSVVSSSGIAA